MISAQQLLRAVVDTGAAQVMVLPNGYVPPRNWSPAAPPPSGGASTWCRCPPDRWCRGWPRSRCTNPGRQAVDDGYTMARAAGAPGTARCGVATEEALTWAGTCEPGDGLGIAGDEVLIVAPDVARPATGLIDLLLGAGGELVTVLIGGGVDADAVESALRAHVHDRHLGTELVTYHTGHRGDALLIGVE